MTGGSRPQLLKAATGIQGLDEVTNGGLPVGRPTLVCGNAGCGKTLLAMHMLYNGATLYDEPAVFMAFEETAEELQRNVASLGYDLRELIAGKKLYIDHVVVEPAQMAASGDYDLEGLFIRLGSAIDSIGAKRVVLDSLDVLFGRIPDRNVLRYELGRLFQWLKEKGVTAVITSESGQGAISREGIEEYVSDCVIVLDHRVSEQISIRRLRIVKYRGTLHGTNEYPFLIDENGISVLPVTSLSLAHQVSNERIPTGIEGLDSMFGGEGYYRGSSILVSGTAGTGKSSLGAHLADMSCRRGERVLYLAFEESASQILRNMGSIGLDLCRWTESEQPLLTIDAARPSSTGLEMHLSSMIKKIRDLRPHVVVIDPLNSFTATDKGHEVKTMLLRLVDYLKCKQVTAFFTSLTYGGHALEQTDTAISSLMDTWLLLTDRDTGSKRVRTITILKSRGMAHSNEIHEFVISEDGVRIGRVFQPGTSNFVHADRGSPIGSE